jgi:hypothetical protein
MSTDREEHLHEKEVLRPDQPQNRPTDAASGSDDVSLIAASDPNDEIPVPIAMNPAEIDERAQVVQALRGKGPPPRTDTQIDPSAAP